jgi:hypothetical protein
MTRRSTEIRNIRANWHFGKMTLHKVINVHIGSKEVRIDPHNHRPDPHDHEYRRDNGLLRFCGSKSQGR